MKTEPSTKRPWQLGFAVWIATGFWVGFVPAMPGTIGAIWGLPLAWAISQIPLVAVQLLVIGVLFAVGVPLCTVASRRIGKKDPGAVVWDEIVTVPMVFLFVPVELMSNAWILMLGFFLHRVFDITKPPPCRQLEKIPDGLGIMIDDVVAGFYACLSLHLILAIAF